MSKLKAYGYKDEYDNGEYGIDCGIVFAESWEEASIIMSNTIWKDFDINRLTEIKIEKGYMHIGEYRE